MASIFKKDDNYVDKPNRNTFDLSFQNNLSLRFGRLIPCFCQEVIPGDSFKIEPTFGLRFLPQVFPVQTRMRAHLHFFYVRNRTIWRNWMDFIGKTKEGLVLPYLFPDQGELQELTESSIFDYMGLPVTIDSDLGVDEYRRTLWSYYGKRVLNYSLNADGFTENTAGINLGFPDLSPAQYNSIPITYGLGRTLNQATNVHLRIFERPINAGHEDFMSLRNNSTANTWFIARIQKVKNPDVVTIGYIPVPANTTDEIDVEMDFAEVENPSVPIKYRVLSILGVYHPNGQNVYGNVSIDLNTNHNWPIAYLDDSENPYTEIRINALPFRAYEAVYNSFYRNQENNPLLIGGKPEYNKYVVNDGDGPCRLGEFGIFNRNWEDDAFTTAVPTPQQGTAPRVGLTGTPSEPVTLHYSNDDGSVGSLGLKANADGYIQAVVDSEQTDAPNLVNALNDAINFGITINDLRNVNALQLWLEKNVRKGYKYRDQLMSHYGVKVSYNDLMMPEFIGGVSRDVTVNQISQTVETETGNLGDMAGQAYVIGNGNSVSHFCDEHGYIIGIISVAPVPNYSQIIPKHFLKHDTFDFFFPEFGKIGMQPIANKELAAMASWLEENGEDTFGYQRAWYDYLANVDQVHGKFNTQFYDFLIQRKFGRVPQLGKDFTTIKNEDLNNIFYVDDGEDKILGQIYFDVKAIRPIPLFGIPSLE